MPNVLDANNLLASLPTYLPPSSSINHPQDAIAALVHAILSVLSFRLIGIDDEATMHTFGNNVLPSEWNAKGPSLYTFRYSHEQSSLRFLVKVLKVSSRTVIHATPLEAERISSLDVNTEDFISPSSFPVQLGENAPQYYGFISLHRIADFTSQAQLKIVQKLIPGLTKEGYRELDDASTNAASGSHPPRQPEPGPARPGPGPIPQPFVPPSHLPTSQLPLNPLEIGRRDREPIFPDPFNRTPAAPAGGDMIVGPDHPMFSGAFDPQQASRERGPWGGDGYLPPMGAPPGARFDPVGPFPPNPLGPQSGPQRGSQPGGFRGPNPRRFGGGPDNDEFMPPGAGDAFL